MKYRFFEYVVTLFLLIDKLVEECSQNIDKNKMVYNETLNDYGIVCNSCTIYIVLFVIAF